MITTAPSNGVLYRRCERQWDTVDGGETLSAATDTVAIADITSGRLKFKPTANANGTGYDSFTFQVQDSGGTANGGVDTDPTANTMTIDVNAVNDVPAGADNTVTTNEDTDYVFAAGDFGFSDPADSDSLAAVIITTAPSNGVLFVDTNGDGNVDGGEAVSATDTVAIADITAGRLKFKPAANANGTGYDSFTFQVQDSGGTANGGVDTDPTANTMTIDVNAVNDAPAGADNTVTTNEDTDYVFAAGDFGFSDPADSDSLAAVIITTAPSNGVLFIDTNGDGNVDGGEAVSATDTVAIADITAGRLKFKPAANANGTGYDSFTFQVQDSGGTANGGVDTDPTANTMTIDVNAVNDAPAGADNTVTTNEDTDYVFAAGDFGFSDPADSDSLAAVIITTAPSNGVLFIDTNGDGNVDGGEAVSATDTVAIADITAGRLKFKPAANANGTGYDSFTFQVQDSGGTANGGVDTDPTANTMTIDVNAVNDAPAGADNTVTTNEDTDYVFAAGDFGFSDAIDSDSFAGVVITTAPSNGVLFIDTNGDGNVDGGEAVSATDTVAIADITAGRLKFKPAANANGTGYDSFTFQVQDSGGTANGGVDTDPTANTMTIDVNAVNDMALGNPFIVGFPTEGQTLTADTSGITDVDGLGPFTYQWYRDGFLIPGATAQTYVPDDIDVGAMLNVAVSFIDGDGSPEGPIFAFAPIGPIANVNDIPIITSFAGQSSVNLNWQSSAVTNPSATITATDADNDPLQYSIVGGADASAFAIDANSGLLTLVDSSASGTLDVIVEVSDGLGGTAQQQLLVETGSSENPVDNPDPDPDPTPDPIPDPDPGPDPSPDPGPSGETPIPPTETVPDEPSTTQVTTLLGQPVLDLPLDRDEAGVKKLNTLADRSYAQGIRGALEEAPDLSVQSVAEVEVNENALADLNEFEEIELATIEYIERLNDSLESERAFIRSAETVMVGFGVGIAGYLLRIAGLAGSMLASSPLWRWMDPIAVLDADEDEKREFERQKQDVERYEDRLKPLLDNENNQQEVRQ